MRVTGLATKLYWVPNNEIPFIINSSLRRQKNTDKTNMMFPDYARRYGVLGHIMNISSAVTLKYLKLTIAFD